MKWEYRVEDNLDENELTELGKKGWELVTVIMKHWTDERKGYEEWTNYYYFKRPVNDDQLRGSAAEVRRIFDSRADAKPGVDRSLDEREHEGEAGTVQAKTRTE